MRRREGYLLIECLVVITVGAVVMGIAVTLLAGLLRIEGAARDDVHRGIVLSRLADQFRRDVHAAGEPRGDAPQPDAPQPDAAARDDDEGHGESWQFELAPDRTVTYRVEPGQLIRTERAGDTVRHRQSFALPPGTTATIRVKDDTEPTIVSLLISPLAETAQPVTTPPTCIDAVLARDRRLAQPQPPSNEASDG